jgi:hypothetical protein
MRGAVLLPALVLASAAAAQEEALRLPSGLEARAFEVITDRPEGGGLIYRFRYVAEGFEARPEQLEAIEYRSAARASGDLARGSRVGIRGL